MKVSLSHANIYIISYIYSSRRTPPRRDRGGEVGDNSLRLLLEKFVAAGSTISGIRSARLKV